MSLGIPAVILLLTLSGCAHHSLPVNQLESPEARGRSSSGHLEVLPLVSGPNLSDPPNIVDGAKATDPQTFIAVQSFRSALGLSTGFNEKIDLGVRISANTPVTVRAKYQFMGEPEVTATQGNFSAAVIAAPGFLFSNGNEGSSRIFSGDLRVLAGYRVWNRHLISAGPFYTFAQVSGELPLASPFTTGIPTSGSISQYGGTLGYQYTIMDFLVRGELAYAKGTLPAQSQVQINDWYFGLLTGLAF